MSANLKLLRKVRCRLLDQDSGQPLPGIVVTLALGTGEDGDGPHIPVSSLSSDATGYLSFDLQPLIDLGLDTASSLLVSAPQLGIEERDLLGTFAGVDGGGNGAGDGGGGNPGRGGGRAAALAAMQPNVVKNGRSLGI